MRDRLVQLVWLCAVVIAAPGALGGCGNEIGDACFVPVDCSPNGDRACIDASATSEGYCTIQGCDLTTCPDEAVCVRFFNGAFDKTCDPADPNGAACSFDELCSIAGKCVARSAEVRFCMRTCGSDGDCRDGYECRDLERMKANGGQPLLAPGAVVDDDAPRFCAKAPG
jgi:hypothetical protein